jgi:tetratricopeptide (TPR) repeat protein
MLLSSAQTQVTVFPSTAVPMYPWLGLHQGATAVARLWQSLNLPHCAQLYVQGWQQQTVGQCAGAQRAFQELLGMGRQIGHQGWIVAAEQAIAALSQATCDSASEGTHRTVTAQDMATAEQCNRAAVLHQQGSWQAAIQAYQQVLSFATQAGHQLAMGRCLNGLGLIYFDQQQFAQAETRFRAAIAVLDELQALQPQAIVHHNLGLAHYHQGQHQLAQRHFQAALELWQQDENSLGLALTLDYLGRVYAHQGDSWVALGSFEAAIDVLNEVSTTDQDVRPEAAALLMQIANLCEQTRHFYLAIAYLQAALAIYQTLPFVAPEIVIWQRLSELYAKAGHPAIAGYYAQQVVQSRQY